MGCKGSKNAEARAKLVEVGADGAHSVEDVEKRGEQADARVAAAEQAAAAARADVAEARRSVAFAEQAAKVAQARAEDADARAAAAETSAASADARAVAAEQEAAATEARVSLGGPGAGANTRRRNSAPPAVATAGKLHPALLAGGGHRMSAPALNATLLAGGGHRMSAPALKTSLTWADGRAQTDKAEEQANSEIWDNHADQDAHPGATDEREPDEKQESGAVAAPAGLVKVVSESWEGLDTGIKKPASGKKPVPAKNTLFSCIPCGC